MILSALNDLLTRLQHVDPIIWTAIAAYFAPYAHQQLKRVADLSEKANYLVALVVIPAVIATLSGLADPRVIGGLHPVIQLVLTMGFAALISQLKYGLSLNPRLKMQQELATYRANTAQVTNY